MPQTTFLSRLLTAFNISAKLQEKLGNLCFTIEGCNIQRRCTVLRASTQQRQYHATHHRFWVSKLPKTRHFNSARFVTVYHTCQYSSMEHLLQIIESRGNGTYSPETKLAPFTLRTPAFRFRSHWSTFAKTWKIYIYKRSSWRPQRAFTLRQIHGSRGSSQFNQALMSSEFPWGTTIRQRWKCA